MLPTNLLPGQGNSIRRDCDWSQDQPTRPPQVSRRDPRLSAGTLVPGEPLRRSELAMLIPQRAGSRFIP